VNLEPLMLSWRSSSLGRQKKGNTGLERDNTVRHRSLPLLALWKSNPLDTTPVLDSNEHCAADRAEHLSKQDALPTSKDVKKSRPLTARMGLRDSENTDNTDNSFKRSASSWLPSFPLFLTPRLRRMKPAVSEHASRASLPDSNENCSHAKSAVDQMLFSSGWDAAAGPEPAHIPEWLCPDSQNKIPQTKEIDHNEAAGGTGTSQLETAVPPTKKRLDATDSTGKQREKGSLTTGIHDNCNVASVPSSPDSKKHVDKAQNASSVGASVGGITRASSQGGEREGGTRSEWSSSTRLRLKHPNVLLHDELRTRRMSQVRKRDRVASIFTFTQR